mmetsp:Transcript_2165/g.3361  ORF Transcript_2165/g.3361 Transcript_2165/m.3361 type:complete len:107 (+) Transcript_2165:124-444(+)
MIMVLRVKTTLSALFLTYTLNQAHWYASGTTEIIVFAGIGPPFAEDVTLETWIGHNRLWLENLISQGKKASTLDPPIENSKEPEELLLSMMSWCQHITPDPESTLY